MAKRVKRPVVVVPVMAFREAFRARADHEKIQVEDTKSTCCRSAVYMLPNADLLCWSCHRRY